MDNRTKVSVVMYRALGGGWAKYLSTYSKLFLTNILL
ncbi:hypothetical protein SAMN05421786_1011162 [Chryseobacterium ureilyticum]|uniref:Uncharacterized protein n=1 Tax=Chryseobacterium ureilyticum TaxID=373668 RepID=A0A1N7LB51_9FLAO|nr:hypothetical protein SAMN05421786_1011162 [Chryseobacterium ureilyticum]